MDQTDFKILGLMQKNADLSMAEIAEQVNLSVTPCWRRRKRLEDEGVITGYQANVDRRSLGMDVFAFVLVTFNMHSDKAADNFEAVIKNRAEVLACHKITGTADYLLQVVATDLDSYGEFVERVLRHQMGISSIQSSLALREVKFSPRIPVPSDQ